MKKAKILLLLVTLLTACAPLGGEPTPMLEAENNSAVVPSGTQPTSASQLNPDSVEALCLAISVKKRTMVKDN